MEVRTELGLQLYYSSPESGKEYRNEGDMSN